MLQARWPRHRDQLWHTEPNAQLEDNERDEPRLERESPSMPSSRRQIMKMAGSIGQVRQLCSLKRAKHFRLRFSDSCLWIRSRRVLAIACELSPDATTSCILARIDNRPDSLYYRY
jgi:hypothetical protein